MGEFLKSFGININNVSYKLTTNKVTRVKMVSDGICALYRPACNDKVIKGQNGLWWNKCHK